METTRRVRSRSWRILVAAVLAFAAPGASAGSEEIIAEVEAGRADLDQRTRDGTMTPFTPVDVRMIAPGERVDLGICDGMVQFQPGPGCEDRLALLYTDAGFRRVGADGAETEAEPVVEFGRFRLRLSRQENRGRILVHDPDAPDQQAFRGYRWFPPDPAYHFPVTVEPYEEETSVRMTTTAGLVKTFRRYGAVRFAIEGNDYGLSVFLAEGGDPADAHAYFIPFRDGTAGVETYPVGRYASLHEDGDQWVLDFNLAGNPNCAYNPHWNCPIPPRENRLSVAIRAGERSYDGHGAVRHDAD